MQNEIIAKQFKENIKQLVEKGHLQSAKTLLEEYEKMVSDDVEIYSMKAAIASMEGKPDEAEKILKEGLAIDNNNLDLNYNLAFVYENLKKGNETIFYYKKALSFSSDEKFRNCIIEKLKIIASEYSIPLECIEELSIKNSDFKINKVLFIQSVPCIRTNKVAKAIFEKGVQVDIMYLAAHPKQVYKDIKLPYKNIYKLSKVNEMIEFINNSDYDILYSSNEPDYLTVLFTATNKPIVHDNHDLMSLRGDITIEQQVLEYIANVKSDGNIYVNPLIKDIAIEKFNLKDKPILTIHSYIEKEQLPKKYYEKLSSKDGEIHCVFEGGLAGIPGHHRFLEPIFLKLAQNNIHVHLHCPVDPEYIKRLVKKSKYIHYEGLTSPENLITEMTKYDIGLAIFSANKRNKTFLDTAFPNKIWDYLAAGLPIFFADLLSFRQFAKASGVGKVLNINGNIRRQAEEVSKIKIDKDFLKNKKWLMNEAADNIINFLTQVKKSYYTIKNHQYETKIYDDIVKKSGETFQNYKKNKLNLNDIEDITSVYFNGRSGSLFLLSLLDSHPNILMIPGDYLRFYHWFWSILEGDFGEKIEKDKAINVFSEIFPFIYDAKNISSLLSKTGYGGDFGERLGFTTMGENQDQRLKIDKHKFVNEINRIFADKKYITRIEFFKAIHIAYFYALDKEYDSDIKPVIVYFPHIYDMDKPKELFEDFPQIKRICILREPIQTFGSHINSYRRVLDHIIVDHIMSLIMRALYGGMISNKEIPSGAIKLEDLHTRPKETLTKICDFINIPWDNVLMESTFDGLKWWNAKTSERMNGFNKKVISRKHEDLFSEFDRQRLKSILFRKYKEWRYDDVYMKDLSVLEKELEEPFKFEEYIYYKNEKDREEGRKKIRNLFKKYLSEIHNDIRTEIKLLK